MTNNAEETPTTTYRVTGMTCGGCAKSLSQAMERTLPGLHFDVSVDKESLTVSGPHASSQVQQAVEAAGFDFGGALT